MKSRIDINSTELVLSSGYTLASAPGRSIVITVADEWYKGAPVRRTDTPRLNADGSFPDRSTRGAKLVPVSGHATTTTRAEAGLLIDELNAYLGDGDEGILRVNDIDLGERWATVSIADGADVRWNQKLDVKFTLYLVMNDPYKYGAKVVTDSVPSGGAIVIPNTGTANSFPYFRIEGPRPANGFTITASDGSVLRYVGADTLEGDILIDSSRTEVWRGEEDDSKLLTIREWTEVVGGGSETYTFDAPGSGATLTGEIYPRWY
jgi:hypothetical protein